MADFIPLFNQENRDSQAFKKFFLRVKNNWYWMLVALVCFAAVGYLFLRYTLPVYQVNTTLLIKDNGGFQDPSEILLDQMTFQDKEKVFNESAIVISHPLIFQTIKQLGFWVSFYSKGTVNNVELYKENSPFDLVVDTTKVFASDPSLPYGVEFKIGIIDNKYFQLTAESDGTDFYPPFSVYKKLQYNQTFKVGNFEFALRLIKPEKAAKEAEIREYAFKIFNLKRLATDHKMNTLVKPEPVGSTILNISIKHSVPQKAIDFLNKLTENYSNQNLALKNEVSVRTINFIDNELAHTSDTLGSVEAQLEQFKSAYQISDIGEEAKMLMEELSKLDADRAKYIVARKYYEYLKNNVSSEDFNNAVFPYPFSISEGQDPVLNKLVMDLISLQLEKKVYLDQGMLRSPQVKLIEDRIKTLRGKILENVTNAIHANDMAMSDLNDRIKQIERSIKQLPRSERQLVNIQRNYKLSENLYVFLMEKRTEAAISRSSNTPDVQIVEPAMTNPDIPVFPKPILIYALMVFLGISVPTGIILVRHVAQNKVIDKSEITQKTNIPFLGSVPHNISREKKRKLVVFEKPRGSIAESFRIIRSNISYMRPGKDHQSTVILLTSSIANEGKTFTSTNLAATLSMTGKKTVLLGLDLRKPKVHEYLTTTKLAGGGLESSVGVSQYLHSDIPVENIIYSTQAEGLFVIPSGFPLPPNPSELLMGERMKQLMNYLRENFTYIILDTPPIGLVTDAFILAEYSNINVFVMRQNVTHANFIDYIDEIYQSKKISNLCILLNDVRESYGYGNGYYSYGYGYYNDSDPSGGWFQKVKYQISSIFSNR